MEPATVHRATDRRDVVRNGALWAARFPLFLLLSLIFVAPLVHGADTNKVLEKSGIRYPEGFDVNTVGDVKGVVQNLVRPEKGPVMFDLATSGSTYTVIASPVWYWDDLKIKISGGDDVKVTGSKTVGKDGILYVVAQEIHVSGASKTFALRDNAGEARWRPVGGASGSRGGYGARGGSGGGFGGGGRGGRR
jgi:hypothetical protein